MSKFFYFPLFFVTFFLLSGCQTKLKTSECSWYREPTAAQCENLYSVDRDLFRKCTLNKMDYSEFCKVTE